MAAPTTTKEEKPRQFHSSKVQEGLLGQNTVNETDLLPKFLNVRPFGYSGIPILLVCLHYFFLS